MRNQGATDQSLPFISSVGVLGGAALIITVSLTHRGPMIYLPYALIVLASAAILRAERVQPFRRRFALHLGGFMAASLVFYLYICLRTGNLIPLGIVGHLWRLAALAAIGSIFSLAVAQLTAVKTDS